MSLLICLSVLFDSSDSFIFRFILVFCLSSRCICLPLFFSAFFFFFKQKTEYEMLISYWSSDVCSSDLCTMFALVQAPPGGTLPRTQKALDVVRDHFLKDEKAAVDSVFTVSGFSFNGQGQNAGLAFIKLKDWKDRSSSENKAQALEIGRAHV